MPKLAQKWNKHVEQIGTCVFSVFAKSITLKSFFGRIQTAKIYQKMNKNRNEITDRKHGAEMLPNGAENGTKWDPKSAGNQQKTLPEVPSEKRFENERSGTDPPTPPGLQSLTALPPGPGGRTTGTLRMRFGKN